MNTDFAHHEITNFTLDLQATYQMLITYKQDFVKKCQVFFSPEYNNLEIYNYYSFVFNEIKQERLSQIRQQNYACLFIYLNLHGAMRFVRYNKQGDFNLPYGDHKAICFPEQELLTVIDSANFVTGVDGSGLKEILYGHYSY